MIFKPKYFSIQELVCPHLYYKYGEWLWQFFDIRLLEVLDWIRERKGPMYVNNYDMSKYEKSPYLEYIKKQAASKSPINYEIIPEPESDLLDERGVRCNLCDTVRSKTDSGTLYASGHLRFQAADFDIQGTVSEEIRQWLIKEQIKIPHPIRLEKNVKWVHLDVCQAETKVQLINP